MAGSASCRTTCSQTGAQDLAAAASYSRHESPPSTRRNNPTSRARGVCSSGRSLSPAGCTRHAPISCRPSVPARQIAHGLAAVRFRYGIAVADQRTVASTGRSVMTRAP